MRMDLVFKVYELHNCPQTLIYVGYRDMSMVGCKWKEQNIDIYRNA